MPPRAPERIDVDVISSVLPEYLDMVRYFQIPEIQRAVQDELRRVFETKKGEKYPDKKRNPRVNAEIAALSERAEQIEGDEDFFHAHQARTDKDFWRSARTRPKLAQELLTATPDRQIFTRQDIAQTGEEGLMDRVVIDPSRITDTLLGNLGLSEYIPKGRKLSARQKVERRAEAIPAIKHMLLKGIEQILFDHETQIHPQKQRYLRLFRITEGENRGYVLGTQSNGRKSLFLSDLQGAYRRIDHIREEEYPEEIKKLNRIKDEIRKIVDRVYGRGKAIKGTEELAELIDRVIEMVESLEHVENEHKVEIREKLERCKTFNDETGKYNPGSRLAIMVSCTDLVGKRIKDISDIMGYLSGDQIRLLNEMLEEANRLNDFYQKVEQHRGVLKITHPEAPISQEDRTRIATNLKTLVATCEAFKYEPYITLAAKIIGEVQKIIGILEAPGEIETSDRMQAQRDFLRTYSAAKMIRLEKNLLDFRQRFFKPGQRLEDIYVKGMVEELKRIEKEFEDKRINPEIVIPDFTGIYGEIYEFFGRIIKAAQMSLGRGKTQKDRVEALTEINKELREFSLAELLKKYPTAQTTSTESHSTEA